MALRLADVNPPPRTNNATIEVIIEEKGFNNSLAGTLNCPNAYTKTPGNEARDEWIQVYLANGSSPPWLGAPRGVDRLTAPRA